jgi:2,3-dihydro-2,3-dihydroxybenzoate dehydrogenase
VAIVTGAANGIGAAVARGLAARGAAVALLDVDEAGATAVAADLPGARAYRADVGSPGAAEAVVSAVERDLGPVDVCANVAGILRTGAVISLDDADWAATFAVNATGVFRMSRAVAGRMVPRRRGTIVTVTSNAAGVPRAGMAAYAASKAAAAMFTRCLGLELAPYGIRCNTVAPGSTDTAMQRSLWTDELGPDSVVAGNPSAYRVGIPLGRLADPADVAEAVVFLASDRARHITMHDLYVDGGASLRG